MTIKCLEEIYTHHHDTKQHHVPDFSTDQSLPKVHIKNIV